MNAHHVPQGLLDRLQSTGAPSDPKTSGKPTGPKSPVKAPVKAAAQPEAVTSPDAPAGPPPADLIIAARLHLSQVHPHTRSSTVTCVRCVAHQQMHMVCICPCQSATAFVLKTYKIVVGLWSLRGQEDVLSVTLLCMCAGFVGSVDACKGTGAGHGSCEDLPPGKSDRGSLCSTA